MPYCGKCGAELRENTEFCHKCGNKQNTANNVSKDTGYYTYKNTDHIYQPETAVSNQSDNKKYIVIAIAAVAVIAAIAVIYILFISNKPDPMTSISPTVGYTQQNSTAKPRATPAYNDSSDTGYSYPRDLTTSKPSETESVEQTDAQDIYDTLTVTQKKDLNVFLSNFSEAFFEYYDSDSADINALISFAFIHDIVNNNSLIRWTDSEMGISADRVDKTLNKYFGKSIPRSSTTEWYYDGEYYWTEAASGESYDYFSVAVKLIDLQDGTYRVDFNNYYAGYDSMDTKYYWYSEEDALYDPNCTLTETGTAVIKPVKYEGKDTWQLLELQVY